MNTPRLVSLLLLTTAFVTPALAHAQATDGVATGGAVAAIPPTPPVGAEDETPEISIPGSEIVVTGRRNANIERAATQVVSVLSTAEIARTGEGNIAGALQRVTGLSVVGSGFVYVRGLGDRYSLALLNGSPLPSPEPLKRVVPLDLFPSGIIASSLVQKSYSVNFPGEFGGGVINLTTRSTPDEGFLTIGAGLSVDSETTGHFGYTYYGSGTDWTGFDNGQRDLPPALEAFFASGDRISSGTVDTTPIASQIVNGRNAVLQRIGALPPNFAANFSAGQSFDAGAATLGVIAAAGYSNTWVTRDTINQTSLQADLSILETDMRRLTTDNRIVANGMLGLGFEFGENTVRWTNLYIRDTLKNSRYAVGKRNANEITDFLQQDTAWFERQLIDSQLVAELRPLPDLTVDLRGAYANSQREAPYELSFEYVRTNVDADPYGGYFVNRLNNGNGGDATVSFSDLNENLWTGGIDVGYRLTPELLFVTGYYYADTDRTSSRRDFQFQAPSDFPPAVGMFRPDLLLQPTVIDYFNVSFIETNEGNPAFRARLLNHAGYGKIDAQLTDTLQLDAGVRYETAEQTVTPIQVFNTPGASLAETNLNRDYWLPAATLTWQFMPEMQVRLNASKTLARPQFRELIYQFYFDPDSNRMFRGNPLLVDSQLTNAEARYEWYFGRNQRFSLAGFYKKIDNPIETFVASERFITSFANAPEATLYGAEVEVQKNFDLQSFGGMFDTRQLLLIGNYTYTKSSLNVDEDDTVAVFAASSTNATDFFRDGASLTGQSDHIVNVQIGLEDLDRLSQQTFLISYASERVTSRGLVNTGQPDIIEQPGLRVDFVARQGVDLFGLTTEWKFEVRNIFGRRHEEYQQVGSNRVDVNTYDVGTKVGLSASVAF
ncbi:TonB-dependent receptor domain-containing protein [Altericroceibacterium xinjiangense]|uniref:TonB-dependent receptor domain-containing protein n=1 Tax=Altericroceibacterium xinjiangense TaxID=762261 RepID=UPI000F7EAF04|nr:TonB-dependent receptor [Altericroceibacterium xinjiangense]